MPLTKSGKKVEHAFEKEYGDKKGKGYFYAKENKEKGFKEAMTRKRHGAKEKALEKSKK